jgi:hypothetical protein
MIHFSKETTTEEFDSVKIVNKEDGFDNTELVSVFNLGKVVENKESFKSLIEESKNLFQPKQLEFEENDFMDNLTEDSLLTVIKGYEIELHGRLKISTKKPQPITQSLNIR